jgi:hypothetical protein
MMDGSHENLRINRHKEIISAENNNHLLAKYQTRHPPGGLLSIGIE